MGLRGRGAGCVAVGHHLEVLVIPRGHHVVEGLLDGELLHGSVRHLLHLLERRLLVQPQPLRRIAQCELVVRSQLEAQLLREVVPVPVAHARVAQGLHHRYVLREPAHLVLDLVRVRGRVGDRGSGEGEGEGSGSGRGQG